MDYNTIKALLEKYFAGETTLTEEAQLRSYFQSGEVHQDFQSYQALFGFFTQEKKPKALVFVYDVDNFEELSTQCTACTVFDEFLAGFFARIA